jgi:ABC-type sugar transport system ATPase subunit
VILLDNLTIASGTYVFPGVTLEVPAGEYAVLMGATGSGKTTILEAVCGLRRVVAGRVLLSGHDVTAAKPAERGIGYVPQDRALFSTMTVREHIAFALVVRRWPGERIARRVEELAELLNIGSLLDRKPAMLAGGEAQRVALGRALAASPGVLLLDEPLTALDEDTRGRMIELLRTVHRTTSATVLHVTHSPTESAALAQRLFVLENGRVEARAPK